MSRPSGTAHGITFTADSDRVAGVYPSGAISGFVGRPFRWGMHDIECPPLAKYITLTWDYLLNSNDHSVQYVRCGKVRNQLVPEQVWAWGMGRPASRRTTHQEQAGYASMSTAQWLGALAVVYGYSNPVGTTFTKPDGSSMTYTEQMATDMADQFLGMADDYADWCRRWGYVPNLLTQDQLQWSVDHDDQQDGQLGGAFPHSMASRLRNTTTSHTDVGTNYPWKEWLARAKATYNGVGTPTVPSTPTVPTTPVQTGDWLDNVDSKEFSALLATGLKANPSPSASGWSVFSPNGRGIAASYGGSRTWFGFSKTGWIAFQKAHKDANQTFLNMGTLSSKDIASQFGKQV